MHPVFDLIQLATPLLCAIAVIIAVVALIIAIKAKNQYTQQSLEYYIERETRQQVDTKLGNLKMEIERTVDARIYNKIKSSTAQQAVEKKTSVPQYVNFQSQLTQNAMNAGQPEIKAEARQAIEVVEEKVEPIQKTEQTATANPPIPSPEPAHEKNIEYVYVGSCKNGSFKYVSPVSDSKTVFCITIEDNDTDKAIIDVDPNAYEKVSQTPDFLNEACNYSGNGSNVEVVKKGIVAKVGGEWVIKTKIVVELN